MEDTMKGARTVEEIQNLAKSKRKGIEKYGCAGGFSFFLWIKTQKIKVTRLNRARKIKSVQFSGHSQTFPQSKVWSFGATMERLSRNIQNFAFPYCTE